MPRQLLGRRQMMALTEWTFFAFFIPAFSASPLGPGDESLIRYLDDVLSSLAEFLLCFLGCQDVHRAMEKALRTLLIICEQTTAPQLEQLHGKPLVFLVQSLGCFLEYCLALGIELLEPELKCFQQGSGPPFLVLPSPCGVSQINPLPNSLSSGETPKGAGGGGDALKIN